MKQDIDAQPSLDPSDRPADNPEVTFIRVSRENAVTAVVQALSSRSHTVLIGESGRIQAEFHKLI